MNNYDYDNNNDVNVPEFLDDSNGYNTNTNSADMSIFNMSDEELYEDEEPNYEKRRKPGKKGINSTIILCLIVIVILLVTSVVSVIYGLNQHKAYIADHDKITQLEAENTDLKNTNDALYLQITSLQNQIKENETAGTTTDPNAKYASGTKLYITQDGHTQGVREKASVDSDIVTKNGSDYTLYWGNSVVLTEDATVDSSGNYWGKIDGGYIRIEYNGEIWASTEIQ